MKHFLTFFALVTVSAASCTKDAFGDLNPVDIKDSEQAHGCIVLGDQLENPYSVENVKGAFSALYPTKSSDIISTTDYYVRFLPEDDRQMDLLKDMGLSLLDHPVDYEVLKDGDWYHDPSIEEGRITWQYAVAPCDFVFPSEIRHEIIQHCFLADHSPSTKAASDIDWDAVEYESYLRSGNGSIWAEDASLTKGESVYPSGRVTIEDPLYNGGQPAGVSGVKVECNVFVKFASAYTDRDGYYKLPKKFTAKPRYRLVFSNSKDFTIGFNTILYKGSVSGFGKNSAGGVNISVGQNSDRKLFRRCCVNNATYDYIVECNNLNIPPPPKGLCMWIFDNAEASSTIMLHHGTVLDGKSTNTWLALASQIISYFSPDITLGTQNLETYAQLYSTTVHELAHASHFTSVGPSYWNKLISFIAMSSISGSELYGDASQSNSGYCAVAEMWSYYLEGKLYKSRYGGSNPMFGSNYWFHPQILTYLESRGLSVSQIYNALASGAASTTQLRDSLVELYPSKKLIIDQVFNRYE